MGVLGYRGAPRSLHSPLLTLPFGRVRRLGDNKLGPEVGMALAEALKSNTALKKLGSAALPLNPLTHASRSFVL